MTEQDGAMTRLSDFARLAKAVPLLIFPWQRTAVAAAIDIEEKRAKAELVGFDFDPVLEDARTISRTTPLPWATVWPRVWELAYSAACRGEVPARVTCRSRTLSIRRASPLSHRATTAWGGSMAIDHLAWAQEFVAGSHYCDYGEHPHEGCECPCSVCFSFWHFNVWRFEEAKKIVASSNAASVRDT